MTRYNNVLPHPNVVAKWKSLQYLPDISSNGFDRVPTRILAAIGQAKIEILKDPQSPDLPSPRTEQYALYTDERKPGEITREISHLYRQKDRDGKEFLFYKQKLSGSNFQGDKDYSLTQLIGRYDDPQYNFTTNRETGVRTIVSAKEPKQVFTLPFAKEFVDPSTDKTTTFEELKAYTTQKMWFYVFVNGIKYELLGVTYDEFVSKSYDELVHKAVYLKWPEQNVETPPAVRRQKKA